MSTSNNHGASAASLFPEESIPLYFIAFLSEGQGIALSQSATEVLIYSSLSGYLLYMHCSHLYRWIGNTQLQHIAQSGSVSEAVKIFTLNHLCLIQ